MDIYIIVKMYSAQDNVKEIDVNITSANTSTDDNFCIFPILK